MNRIILIILVGFLQCGTQNSWVDELKSEIVQIEKAFSGNLGIYVKDLGENRAMTHKADQYWYLASTVKIPVAIAILQKVEAGELSLDDTLTLSREDFVDGAGDLLYAQPGSTFTVKTVLQKMIKNSDSVATDMLIRLMGVDAFNEHIRKYIMPDGIQPLTTILQVRYDAYSEIHPDVASLSNMDIIRINSADSRDGRYKRIMELLDLSEDELRVRTIEEAFERYYKRGLNSGKPEAMGMALEKLYKGELLSVEHTRLLLEAMETITTGDDRIKAGLPDDYLFAQKTGTQVKRMCNMGIIYQAGQDRSEPVVIVACAEKYDSMEEAENVLEQVGALVSRTLLQSK